MKTPIKALLACICLVPVCGFAAEIALYDSEGDAVAYVDTGRDSNIYLWSGKPVAYLNEHSIYGFNGKHVGWLENGIVRDHEGLIVGFVDGATHAVTKLPPLKGSQELTPSKALRQSRPPEPSFQDRRSRISLTRLLSSGIEST